MMIFFFLLLLFVFYQCGQDYIVFNQWRLCALTRQDKVNTLQRVSYKTRLINIRVAQSDLWQVHYSINKIRKTLFVSQWNVQY